MQTTLPKGVYLRTTLINPLTTDADLDALMEAVPGRREDTGRARLTGIWETAPMSRVRHLLFLAALGAGAAGCRSVGPSEVQLPAKLDNRLQGNAQACVERLNRDRTRARAR